MGLIPLVVACTHIPPPARLPDDAGRGRELLAAAVAAHGGREAFFALGDLRVRIADHWHTEMSRPHWPGGEDVLVATFNPELDKVRLAFAGDPDDAWGHDSVEGWVQVDGRRAYDADLVAEASFWAPTLAWFLEMPFRLLDDAAIVRDAGPGELEGRTLDRVAVTFPPGVGTATDRYLAWLDPATHRLVALDYTVRDQGRIPEGRAFYRAWQDLEGVLLPRRTEMRVIRPLPLPLHDLDWTDPRRLAHFDRTLYEKPSGQAAAP